MSAGKGDKPRPKSVDDKTFSENWERVFGKTAFENAIDALSDDPALTPEGAYAIFVEGRDLAGR